MRDFTGYILSGGKSSRMGMDKAFLEIGAKTFLENAVGILNPICEQIKIVINKSQIGFIEKFPDGVSFVFDRFDNRGALGGVHAALADCQTKFAVVLAIDLPFVTSEAIGTLCEVIADEKDFSAVVPRQLDGRMQPLCAIYCAPECLRHAKELLTNTDSASMRDFLQKIRIKIIDAESLGEENLFANINSPNDYKNHAGEIR